MSPFGGGAGGGRKAKTTKSTPGPRGGPPPPAVDKIVIPAKAGIQKIMSNVPPVMSPFGGAQGEDAKQKTTSPPPALRATPASGGQYRHTGEGLPARNRGAGIQKKMSNVPPVMSPFGWPKGGWKT